MLTKELKKKWLDALKSGKYIQGTTQLIMTEDDQTRHCCLGVLAEVCGYKFTDNGLALLDSSGNSSGYQLLYNHLKSKDLNTLYETNDSLNYGDKRNYSNVIPLIEDIKTID